MSEQEKCTQETQIEIARAAVNLRAISEQLNTLRGHISQAPGLALPDELRGGLQTVRSNLLADAADTLNALG